MSEEKRINVTTLFGAKERKPLVEVALPGPELRIQMTVAEARDLAMNILQASEAALSDGFVFHFFKTTVDSSDRDAALIMTKFRGYRTAHTAEGS